VSLEPDKNNGYLHEDQYISLIISRSFLLIMRNYSDKICRENQNTHFVFINFFFENRTVYGIMWKNIVERDRPQVTIWRTRIACWITQAKNTHSEYVILIALPRPQWLHEHASMLRFTYSAALLGFRRGAVEISVSLVIGVRRCETAFMV
jgi:hypothetical protein